jgi:hypothetical protein
MIPLPEPVKLRREIRRDGGYNMVPAYTADQLHAYAAACVAEERERIAQMFDLPLAIKGEAEDWMRSAARAIRAGGDA